MLHRGLWSWRRWRLTEGPAVPIRTRWPVLTRPPAVILGSWLALVVVGIVTALIVQSVVLARLHVAAGPVLRISLASIVSGILGGKLWYLVLHRRTRRRDGWCIQGFVAGVAVVAPALLLAVGAPVGIFLDASSPGLLFGLAIGRMGCFFTGCCVGRPTAARWGVWSSDRRLGMRRVPTQLMESTLALLVGSAVLAAVLSIGPAHGTLLVAALAIYTLGRQGLLKFRAERRKSRFGVTVSAAVAAVVLVTVVLLLSLGAA